ncbi:MAG: hypothetical protein IJ615_04810, partial [Bacteroidaceae bacterium]|nr:hypothetical protein [Bacteroidaceae bacterium]
VSLMMIYSFSVLILAAKVRKIIETDKKMNPLLYFQNFFVPLHLMASHKNGWWLVIECSLMQIIAEQRIENGLLSGLGFAACQSKNPQNPQSPELPLYKEIL